MSGYQDIFKGAFTCNRSTTAPILVASRFRIVKLASPTLKHSDQGGTELAISVGRERAARPIDVMLTPEQQRLRADGRALVGL